MVDSVLMYCLSLSTRTPRHEKSALFSCVSVHFFGKTGRVSYFCTNLCCITEIPVASWVFGTRTYRPCPMIPSCCNADACICILHACDVSFFTIANYNVMGTSGATDKCTKMLNSRWVFPSFIFYLFTPKMQPFSRRRVQTSSYSPHPPVRHFS